MYHRVTSEDLIIYNDYRDTLDALVVTRESFRRQMAWLAGAGYRALTLDELLDAREQSQVLPRRVVVITFDDGYQDFADNAAPILQQHGFSAHLFLVAGLVGATCQWDSAVYGWEFPLFDWDTARELQAQGFHCEAHTVSHPSLTSLSATEAEREINDSLEILRQELGREVRHFAYPYGHYNAETQRILRNAGVRSACSVRRGRSPADDDPYALRRVCVHNSDSLFDFKCAVMSGLPVRSAINRWLTRFLGRS
jgi:peptidoglycan/xylan/chitin deacetylase (PgdA/CDA1 family)